MPAPCLPVPRLEAHQLDSDIQLYKVQLLRAAARYLGGRGGEGPMAVPDCMRAVHEKANIFIVPSHFIVPYYISQSYHNLSLRVIRFNVCCSHRQSHVNFGLMFVVVIDKVTGIVVSLSR